MSHSSTHSCCIRSLCLKDNTIGIETDGAFTQFWLPLETALCMDIRIGDTITFENGALQGVDLTKRPSWALGHNKPETSQTSLVQLRQEASVSSALRKLSTIGSLAGLAFEFVHIANKNCETINATDGLSELLESITDDIYEVKSTFEELLPLMAGDA